MTRIPRWPTCFCFGGSKESKSFSDQHLRRSLAALLLVKGNGMRRLGNSLASAFRARNLICIAMAVVGLWAATSGVLPLGPRPSVAVEAKPVQEMTGPTANDRTVTRLVAMMMKREHLTKHPLDDEISRRGLDLFLKSLDSRKLYFYQSDVDEFNKRRNELDDMVSAGDV